MHWIINNPNQLDRMHSEFPVVKEDFHPNKHWFIDKFGIFGMIAIMELRPGLRMQKQINNKRCDFEVPNQFPRRYKLRYTADYIDCKTKDIAEFLMCCPRTVSRYKRLLKEKAPLSKGQQSKGNGNIN